MKPLVFPILILSVFMTSVSFAETDEYNFSEVHEKTTTDSLKSLVNSKAFAYGLIGASAVTGVVVTYVTAGAGAPAVATGMSSVATWAGGAGAGSYMAGLSTIGGVFGGNAITGAAVLNGLAWSAGVTSTGKLVAMPLASKLLLATTVTATTLDGVMILRDTESPSDRIQYIVDLQIPTSDDFGSKVSTARLQELTRLHNEYHEKSEELNSIEQKKQASDGDGVISKVKKLLGSKDKNECKNPDECESSNAVLQDLDRLNKEINAENSAIIDDLKRKIDNKILGNNDAILMGVMAYRLGEYDLFQQAVSGLEGVKGGYINYLRALGEMLEYDLEAAKKHLERSIIDDPKVIESRLLYLNLFDEGSDLTELQKIKIENLITEAESIGGYITPYNIAALYFRAGMIFEKYKDHLRSLKYYELARNEVSDSDAELVITLKYANALYETGRFLKSREIMLELLSEYEDKDNEQQRNIKEEYTGTL